MQKQKNQMQILLREFQRLFKNDCNKSLALSKFRGLDYCNESLPFEELVNKFFSKDSASRFETSYELKYEYWCMSFASTQSNEKLDPLDLDPFIARYILALNDVGIFTIDSCDDWHKEKKEGIYVIFKERYSMIWHSLICDMLNLLKFEYDGRRGTISRPKTDSEKVRWYIKVNKNAEILEKNMEYLQKLKEQVVNKLDQIGMDNLSDIEVKEAFESAIRECN